MADSHDRSRSGSKPVLCTSCQQPLETPLCCAGCGALNPLPPSLFTYFELFGTEPTYDIDAGALHRKYLSLSRSIHPDMAGRASETQRRQALALSSGLNRAYDTLREPVSRAEYLLSLAGGPSAANDKTVSPQLLGEVMMLREEMEEAGEAGDTAALQAMRSPLADRQAAVLDAIAEICRHQDLTNPSVRARLRQELNAVKYWNNLLDQIPTMVDG